MANFATIDLSRATLMDSLSALAGVSSRGVTFYDAKGRPERLSYAELWERALRFAAGLVSRGVLFLQGSGDLGSFNDAVYNLTGQRWLTQDTQSGRFLAGIFGWDPRPSIEQVVVYLGYLIPVLILFFKKPKAAAPAPARSLDHATV